MPYDPRDYRLDWRDVATGILLWVISLSGLLMLGGGSHGLSETTGSIVRASQVAKHQGCCGKIVHRNCPRRTG